MVLPLNGFRVWFLPSSPPTCSFEPKKKYKKLIRIVLKQKKNERGKIQKKMLHYDDTILGPKKNDSDDNHHWISSSSRRRRRKDSNFMHAFVLIFGTPFPTRYPKLYPGPNGTNQKKNCCLPHWKRILFQFHNLFSRRNQATETITQPKPTTQIILSSVLGILHCKYIKKN